MASLQQAGCEKIFSLSALPACRAECLGGVRSLVSPKATSDAERSRLASAAGAEEQPVPSDRQAEQNVNNAAISYIILEH